MNLNNIISGLFPVSQAVARTGVVIFSIHPGVDEEGGIGKVAAFLYDFHAGFRSRAHKCIPDNTIGGKRSTRCLHGITENVDRSCARMIEHL